MNDWLNVLLERLRKSVIGCLQKKRYVNSTFKNKLVSHWLKSGQKG